ncbi:hypothetical protein [Acidovorax phage ACPWH]|nr:hypothetical protein [Acidovorax phage ACPWH]
MSHLFLPHFWQLFFGLPIATFVLAFLWMKLWWWAYSCAFKSDVSMAFGACAYLLGFLAGMTASSSLLAFILVIVQQGLHMAGVL